ncbi:hypothetical protein J6590_088236 [Homalodisca vitripennis]|nr:hypothetical protein J6590_088236 [Homalodisca vitripennis]
MTRLLARVLLGTRYMFHVDVPAPLDGLGDVALSQGRAEPLRRSTPRRLRVVQLAESQAPRTSPRRRPQKFYSPQPRAVAPQEHFSLVSTPIIPG